MSFALEGLGRSTGATPTHVRPSRRVRSVPRLRSPARAPLLRSPIIGLTAQNGRLSIGHGHGTTQPFNCLQPAPPSPPGAPTRRPTRSPQRASQLAHDCTVSHGSAWHTVCRYVSCLCGRSLPRGRHTCLPFVSMCLSCDVQVGASPASYCQHSSQPLTRSGKTPSARPEATMVSHTPCHRARKHPRTPRQATLPHLRSEPPPRRRPSR